MKIRFEITVEDLVFFNRYHCDHSPTVRRARARVYWVPPLMIMLFGTMAAISWESLPLFYGTITAAVMCIPVALLIAPPLNRLLTDRMARRLYQEGANKAFLGIHELEVTESSLIERTSFNESSLRWHAVEKIISIDGYTFIYTSAMGAHVIPRNAVLEGDYESFLEAVARAEAAARAQLLEHSLAASPKSASTGVQERERMKPPEIGRQPDGRPDNGFHE